MSLHVLVIGGGVTGLSTAYALLRQGQVVTLADFGHAGQSSWAGAGILCPLLPWDYDEAVNRLALSGMQAWPDWAAEIARHSGLDPEYWACGMEVLAGEWQQAALDWCRTHDFPAFGRGSGRVWLPAVAQIRNPRLIAALAGAVRSLGGRILAECKITGLRAQGRKVVVAAASAQGEHGADVFVWAGGAWAGQSLGETPAVPNIRPVRGQMLLYAPGSHGLDHVLYRDGLYLVPRRDGHLLAGSTLEDAGFDASTAPETLHRLHEAACRLLPDLRGHAPIRSWAGLRPGSPDNIPVIDRHPDYDNVWVSTGHFRYGVTMAPAGSRLLAELMLGKTPHIDPAPYAWQAALERHWQGGAC
ncbi:MAG: FAD-dependent oxidoreductase [Pseudomonadota bacterium]